jgi:hypothetical protein
MLIWQLLWIGFDGGKRGHHDRYKDDAMKTRNLIASYTALDGSELRQL